MAVPRIRPVDQKRMQGLLDRTEKPLEKSDIWYLHSVFCQCFLPYKDPKTDTWERRNGDFSITLISGHVRDPRSDTLTRRVGLPFGPKPRLFQSYICMQAVKNQSAIIPIEGTMTEMMHILGLGTSGGQHGTIRSFKEQITRFSAANFSIIGPGAKGVYSHVKTTPIRRFDVFFPTDPNQGTLWPNEIHLTTDFYESLKDHAIPFDFRALKPIQAVARSIDVYLWLTQRLPRLARPLLLRWPTLHEMFGGELAIKAFRHRFPQYLRAASLSYPTAKIEAQAEGFLFKPSPPPVPRVLVSVKWPESWRWESRLDDGRENA
jgi:hypothetical protein